MGEGWKSGKTLVSVLAFILFLVQMVYAFNNYLEKPTMQSTGTRPFSSLDRPLTLAVCRLDQFDSLQSLGKGYALNGDFLHGKLANDSMISWAGSNGNLTYEETRNALYSSTNPTYFLIHQNMVFANFTKRFLLPYGPCQVYEGLVPSAHMSFYLDAADIENSSSHALYISDPAASTTFQLSLMNGDRVNNPGTIDNQFSWRTYNIQIKESINKADDGSCVNYPNAEHENYAACSTSEMRKKIMPSLGCMVPWISEEDACTGTLNRLEEHNDVMSWLRTIVTRSFGRIVYRPESCLPPCTILSAHATFCASTKSNFANVIELYFSLDIEVEKIKLAYDSGDLLVEIGSCLGLWLGLSVVGIYEVIVLAVSGTNKLFMRMSTKK